ncbi:MAG: cytidylate kinase-like family protein [Candidatus Eiseniibacteriota bacterium]|jgi:cytidylate kinase
MQIICVSRATHSGGVQLAEKLASRLDAECIAREELTDAATRAGIPVGRLEMAAVRRRPMSEPMALEKERFKAFVTATLCERALKGNLVYHGRTGHIVLPGVDHVLRVRAITDPESRIAAVMQRLGISRQKARQYVEQVDEDRHRWVRTLHNIDWEDPDNYDVVVNLSHMNADNAAAGLVSVAMLPDFQTTPASTRALEDLFLAAQCRLAIGAHPPTARMQVDVAAHHGRVAVTYLPRDRRLAEHIPQVLEGISGAREIVCTMASASLLWIQERFDPGSPELDQILSIAGKWNAAVELVRLIEPSGDGTSTDTAGDGHAESAGEATAPSGDAANGGILDDAARDDEASEDPGFRETQGRLVEAGRAGGHRVIVGGAKEILARLDRTARYSLVVVGDVHLSRGDSVRKRLRREIVAFLADNLRVPVVEADEIREQYMFGPRQWMALFGYGAVAALLLVLVLTHQIEVLQFTTGEGTHHRILSTIGLLVCVPVFAHTFGSFTRYLLRLIRLE